MVKNFEKIIDNRLAQVKHLLLEKGKEYHRDGNPFHNFQKGAEITGTLPTKVLDGFLLKHFQ